MSDYRPAATERPAPPIPPRLAAPAVDAHCHVDLLDVPVAEAVAAARAAGVERLVTVGYSVPSSQWCARAAEEHAEVVAAVAVHPNDAMDADADALGVIAELAALPQVRAVGETGLDYYWKRTDPAVQQEIFRRHIDIAKQLGKALVIHDRDAHADVLRILDEVGPPERTVFHCFSGDLAMAKVCVEKGYFLSFSGTVTFKNAPDVREAAAWTPLDAMLVETDAPFLTPMPYRGHRNGPYLVALTIRAIAALKGVPEEEVATRTTANALQVFGSW